MQFHNVFPQTGGSNAPVQPYPTTYTPYMGQQPVQSKIKRITLEGYQASPIRNPNEEPSQGQTFAKRVVTTTYNEGSQQQIVTGSPMKVSYRKYYDAPPPAHPEAQTFIRDSARVIENQNGYRQVPHFLPEHQRPSYQPMQVQVNQNMPRVESLPKVQFLNSIVFDKTHSTFSTNHGANHSQVIFSTPNQKDFNVTDQAQQHSLISREGEHREPQPSEMTNILGKVSRMENEIGDLRRKNQQLLELVSLQNNYEQIIAQKQTERAPAIAPAQRQDIPLAFAPETISQPQILNKTDQEGHPTDPAKQQLADENTRLKAENEKLSQDIAKAKEKLKKAKAAKSQLKKVQTEAESAEELKSQLSILDKANMKIRAEYNTLNERHANREKLLREENEALKHSLGNARSDAEVLRVELEKLDNILQNQPPAEEFDVLQQLCNALKKENQDLHEAYINSMHDKDQSKRKYSQETQSILEEHLKRYNNLEKAYMELKDQKEAMSKGFEKKETELEETVELLRKKLENLSGELEELTNERNDLIEKMHRRDHSSDHSNRGDEIVVINEIEHLEHAELRSPALSQGQDTRISQMISKDMNIENFKGFPKNVVANMETELATMSETLNRQNSKIDRLKAERFEGTMRLIFSLSEIERLQAERPFRE